MSRRGNVRPTRGFHTLPPILCAIACALPTSGVASGHVAEVSRAPNDLDVVVSNCSTGHVWHTNWNGANWQWEDLGKPDPYYVADLELLTWAGNRLDLFATSASGTQLWHRGWNQFGWLPWENLNPPQTLSFGALEAVSWGVGRIDLFAIALSGHVLHTAFNGSAWQSWDDLGVPGDGAVTLSAVSWGSNRLDALAMTASGHAWHTAWNGSSWQSWDDRGLVAVGHPLIYAQSLVAWSANRLDDFVVTYSPTGLIAPDGGRAYHLAWNGSSWESAWDDRGIAPSGPLYDVAAATWSANRLDVFSLGMNDGHVWHNSWNGSNWESAWDDRGEAPSGRLGPMPGSTSGRLTSLAAVAWGPNRLDVFALGNDQHLWHDAWTGTAWQGSWDDRGGPGGYCMF